MTSTAELGFDPDSCVVHLTRDADFTATIRTADSSDWPAGALISLELTPAAGDVVVWAAAVSGSDASWNVDKVDVNALVPKTAWKARVLYHDDSGADLVWFIGSVVWHG